ncbi:hypothetical protein [Flavicella sp.]|uniref:hypothetical protein n=1 Tax=Flavicella sp. TaxID=2957742 RepID=UPI0030161773
MVRYPHIAYLIVRSESFLGKPKLDENGDSISVEEPVKTELTGRYEPKSGNKNLDYSGVFYTKKLDVVPFEKDGHYLEVNGKEYTVVQLDNYQNHCEICLE